ncbi:hypothetical protein JEY40_24745 [Bradyrhizobium japonicum]|uniref:helix-turn-helix domain-containing protein n=1 Tax=Bradyrhizobium japonicum TaxID=375 RepID=UPI00200D30F3|nr:helix-turn-helix domain-containing protein [Bradyrhizobium japonicum]UQD69227.1 hypothetical protein JEY40_24745 [Bradyrhizobium japonicum]WAX24490.1 hypothetical protein [Bradyrhizobium phage ppBjS10J-1]
MEESRQFVAYQETMRARNMRACDALLSRLVRFHGDAFVKVEPVIVIEAAPEPVPVAPAALELTIPPLAECVTELEEQGPRKPTIKEIRKCVSRHFKISLDDMDSQRRLAGIVLPRQVSHYLAKKLTKHSLPEIGRRCGGKDHTTILNSVKKITARMQSNPKLAETIATLEAQFQ